MRRRQPTAGRFSNSFALVKASANVLRMDKELMVFPLMSGVATVLIAANPELGCGV